jgi:hypothetical protein
MDTYIGYIDDNGNAIWDAGQWVVVLGFIPSPLDPDRYGPSFFVDNLMMRHDDKPTNTYWPDPFTVPGKGRGN